MNLNDYVKERFKDFETKLELNKWYRLDPNRPDADDLKSAIKLRIDLNNDMEFNSDYSQFKKIDTIETMFDKEAQIEYWSAKMQAYRLKNPLEVKVQKVAPGKRR